MSCARWLRSWKPRLCSQGKRRAQRHRHHSSGAGVLSHRTGGDADAYVHALGRAPGLPDSALRVSAGDEAGIKSATFGVNGQYAYGLMISEIGVHRLVRISLSTSQAPPHVLRQRLCVAEIDESIEIDIKPTISAPTPIAPVERAGSTSIHDSAVRITHIPTGISLPARTSARSTRIARRR